MLAPLLLGLFQLVQDAQLEEPLVRALAAHVRRIPDARLLRDLGAFRAQRERQAAASTVVDVLEAAAADEMGAALVFVELFGG